MSCPVIGATPETGKPEAISVQKSSRVGLPAARDSARDSH